MNITFIYPYLISLIIPISALLFWIYRNKGNAKEVKISSLLLYANFEASANSKQKSYIPLRLLLELLFIIFLILLIAGLNYSSENQRNLIILDRSISTNAYIQNDTKINSKIIEQVNDFINFNYDSTFDLIEVNGSGVNSNLSGSEISNLINASYAPYVDNLDTELSKVNFEKYNKALIASDKKVKIGNITNISTISLPKFSLSNLFIESINVNNSAKTLSIKINHSSDEQFTQSSVSGDLLLLDDSGNEYFKDKFEVLKNSHIEKNIPLPNIKNPKIKIKTDNLLTNSLLEDDVVLVSDYIQSNSIFLDEIPENFLNLPKLPWLNLSNSQVDLPSNGMISGKLDENYSNNTLFYLYNVQDRQLGVATEWDIDNEILNYISFEKERKFEYSPINCPSWAKTILKVNGKSVLCFGENRSKKFVFSGIKIFPFVLGKNTTTNIIVLNSLKWLFSLENKNNISSKESIISSSEIVYNKPVLLTDINENDYSDSLAIKLILILSLMIIFDSFYLINRKKLFGK